MRGHDVDLAIEHGRVVEQFRHEEHAEDVVVVSLERRSRVVAVPVRREQLVEGARVQRASERRLEVGPIRVGEVDPGDHPGVRAAHGVRVAARPAGGQRRYDVQVAFILARIGSDASERTAAHLLP